MSASPREWLEAWEKARALYPADGHGMPVPTWASRGFAARGAAAWVRLAGLAAGRRGPISIYAHVPFCRTRCPFCDCHATALSRVPREAPAAYVRRLCDEAAQWGAIEGLGRRPVTTVHLGGGTPHALEPREFEQAVGALASVFAVDRRTEWALETSSRCLDDAHIAQLAGLGFTRIHVGVQTLNPRLRSLLGRREAPETALARIRACLGRGWIVSADMLYGLPGQTAAGLVGDLRRLASAGVHGVSLYRLNGGGFNGPFMARHGLAERGPERLFADYLVFMEAAALLRSLGYAKNHFTHFALPGDANLYSRHAARGEDLLALGATADGVFGDGYYRHGPLEDYMGADAARPPLQGCDVFTPAEARARGLVVQLMSGAVAEDGLDEPALRLVRRLEEAGLLERAGASRAWALTDSGSWFIEACTVDAWRLYEDAPDTRAAGAGGREP